MIHMIDFEIDVLLVMDTSEYQSQVREKKIIYLYIYM